MSCHVIFFHIMHDRRNVQNLCMMIRQTLERYNLGSFTGQELPGKSRQRGQKVIHHIFKLMYIAG